MRFAIGAGALTVAMAFAPAAAAADLSIASPDGKVRVAISDEGGSVGFRVDYAGEPILTRSALGLHISAGGPLGPGLKITGSAPTSTDTYWTQVAGRASRVRDRSNGLIVDLAEPNGRRLRVIFRAYDEGVAFRYVIPEQEAVGAVDIYGENTRFQFATDFNCLGMNLGRFGTSHEAEFDFVRPSQLRPQSLFDRPFVCQMSQGRGIAITEADLRNWSAMYLKGEQGGAETVLSPRYNDGGVAVRTRFGEDARSPWRVIMLARSPGALAESSLVATLNPPTEISDTSWIKPGKAAWDWWNGPALKPVPKAGMNMETLRGYIDFASENGFPYFLIDEGWYAGAGGGAVVRKGANVTRMAPGIDIPELVRYAKQRNVGLMLWLNWKAFDEQFEEALDLYAAWGIKGLKIDFMDRDDQQMVAWYHLLLRETAKRKLMIDLHGAFPPTGLTRTYPHFVTQEGILGAEYNKFSSRVTADHNVRLAYSRALLGPSDYTPGGFLNVAPTEFKQRWLLPMVPHTRAHALALFVVYESPLTVVSDSPDTYAASPAGFDLIKAVPTGWDETRFVGGAFGKSIAIARRKGAEWWVGAIAGDAGASLQVPLDFLGTGNWTLDHRGDDATPEALTSDRRTVTRADSVRLDLKATGGAMLRLTPVGRRRQ